MATRGWCVSRVPSWTNPLVSDRSDPTHQPMTSSQNLCQAEPAADHYTTTSNNQQQQAATTTGRSTHSQHGSSSSGSRPELAPTLMQMMVGTQSSAPFTCERRRGRLGCTAKNGALLVNLYEFLPSY